MGAKSTRSDKRNKPSKPRRDFPLFAHASGQWAKKIRGRMHYFGVWDDPDAAERRYLRQRADLETGRRPRPVDLADNGLTLADVCNYFLTFKAQQHDVGELSSRSLDDYKNVAKRLIGVLGRGRLVDDLRPDDFAELRQQMSKTLGPARLRADIRRTKTIFKYAYEAELIDRPIRFGPGFKPPSAKTIRQQRAAKGERHFTAEQIHTLLGAGSDQLRAMILLAVNCGLGNSDLGHLERRHVDIDTGWLNYPRPKTGIRRRAKLWPETVHAINRAIEVRPEAKNPAHAGLVFITKYGQPWYRPTRENPITKEFRRLAERTAIYRPGLTFYALRHTFATIAGDTRDQIAVNAIMGHVDDSMPALYRERIEDARLERVADHVHGWLFGQNPTKEG